MGSLGAIIIRQLLSSSGTGVASALCPTNSLVVSASCGCDNRVRYSELRGFVRLRVAGNGGVAGCFADSGTYNPAKANPLAKLALVCISARTNAGNEIAPVPVSASGGVSAQSMKATADELESTIKLMQDQVDDHTSSLKK